MEIIASHANPDFDACASMVAATKIYPEARAVFLGSQNRNVREFFALHGGMVSFLELGQVDTEAISRLIVVDTRVADRLGELAAVAERRDLEVFCYDHHPASPEDMRCVRDFSREVGATTTILVRVLKERGVRLSVFEATLLALGIHEDTGSLTFQTTTAEDVSALAWLMDQGAAMGVLARFLTRALSDEQGELYRQLEDSGRIERVHGVDVLIAEARVDEYVDAASVLTHRLADTMDVDVMFSLVEMKDRVHIIGRSRAPQVDAGAVLAEFGGGGHPQAASAAVRRRPRSLLAAQLREALQAHVRPVLTARDIMSRTVRSVTPSASVSHAGGVMRRYGHGGLPVVSRRRIVGLITRRDVEKAELHGLGHAPVKGFMSSRPILIGPDTTLPEMQRILIEGGVGRLPVVVGERVVGIVSRKDVLRALHGRDYIEGVVPGRLAVGPDAIRDRLAAELPSELSSIVARIGNASGRSRSPVYLVGGFVRDLLLGVSNLDVDLVVEGEGIAFARLIADELGGRLRGHEKFGTAVVILPNGFRLDVASARSEFYAKPAALPTVEPGASLRQDLLRRDFTINAMAIGLGGSRDAQLVDFFGGVRDLERGVVRVLHNLSFVEDPTRIYRAVRFEQRYGFRMDEQTETLARQAVVMGFEDKLSGSRVREEIVALLSEADPWKAFRRLIEIGAARELEPKARLGARLGNRFAAIGEASRRLDPYFRRRTRTWLSYLSAVMEGVSADEVVSWGRRMRLRKGDAAVLSRTVGEAARLAKRLGAAKALSGSALAGLLGDLPQEMLVAAWAMGSRRARERIEFYLEHLADVRPAIDGKELLAMGFSPSPLVGEVLEGLRAARLDKTIKDRAGEVAYASEYARRHGVELVTRRPARKRKAG